MPARIKFLLSAFLGVIFLVSADKAWAKMEFKIDGIENNPSEINYDQPINVLFSFSNVSPPKTYYLEGVFQQSPGSRYFGYTWNNNWYSYGENYTNFYKLDINESSVSGKLQVKSGSDSDGFKGTGEYRLKIFRFCSSKSPCGETNVITVKINGPSPLSPSPTPEPDPTQSPESEPDPTSSPVVSPSPKTTTTTVTGGTTGGGLFDSHDSEEMLLSTEDGEILGITEPEASEATEIKKEKNPFLISIILVILGLGFVGGTGVVFYKQRRYNETHEESGKT